MCLWVFPFLPFHSTCSHVRCRNQASFSAAIVPYVLWKTGVVCHFPLCYQDIFKHHIPPITVQQFYTQCPQRALGQEHLDLAICNCKFYWFYWGLNVGWLLRLSPAQVPPLPWTLVQRFIALACMLPCTIPLPQPCRCILCLARFWEGFHHQLLSLQEVVPQNLFWSICCDYTFQLPELVFSLSTCSIFTYYSCFKRCLYFS